MCGALGEASDSLPRLRAGATRPDTSTSLEWTAGHSVLSHGVRFGIRTTEREVMPRLLETLPHGWRISAVKTVDRLYSFVVGGSAPSERIRRFHVVYDNWTLTIRLRGLADAVHQFGVNIRVHVAERAPRRTFVHAGAVSWKGRAVVLPGGTNAGKTTLTAALVRAGATYLSDEFALFDAAGRVHPFPKPLSFREQPWAPQVDHEIESIGGRQARGPVLPGLIVVTSYEEGRRFRPRTISAGRGVMELLQATPSARYDPASAFERLSVAVARAPVLKGVRGEADEAAAQIIERLEALPRP